MSPFVAAVIPVVSKLLDKVIPDKGERERLAHEIATQTERHQQEIALAQIEVNKVEAAHPSIFVSGVRPIVMWVCGVSMAANFLLIPFSNLVLTVAYACPTVLEPGQSCNPAPTIAPLELDVMLPVLLGLLGLGGMRSFEKARGVARMR